MSSKTTWLVLLLGALIRHAMTALGGWFLAKGLIDETLHGVVVAQGSEWLLGVALVAFGILWSAFNKSKLMAWVREALHLPASASMRSVKEGASGVSTHVPLMLVLALSGALMLPVSACRSYDIGTLAATDQRISPEQAKKALVIVQDVRTETLKLAAQLFYQHRLTLDQINQIDGIDARVRHAWSTAASIVDLWSIGEDSEHRFKLALTDAKNALAEMQAITGGAQ